VIFDPKSSLQIVFLLPFYLNKWFSHRISFCFCDFVILVRRCFVCRLCATLIVFSHLFRYLFVSDCQISFASVHIQIMILVSTMLQIQRHDYSRDFSTVICVGLCTLPFYAINIDAVSLFTDSPFFCFYRICIASMYSINLNKWMLFINWNITTKQSIMFQFV